MNGLRTDLGPFLTARRAVVLGASERSGLARNMLHNLAAGGCAVAGTHPRAAQCDGHLVVPSVADLDELPEIACVALGAGTIAAGMEDALEAGVRHFVVPGLGPEAGPAGEPARERITELCEQYGAAMVGPNGMGVLVPGGASAWIGSVPESMRPGRVGILVESGSIGEALTGAGPRIGIRAIFSSGNETVRDAADTIAFLTGDDATAAIGLMLETVRRPTAFAEALGLAARAGKPVVVLKTGTSAVGAERAMAHSGAIAGSDAAFDAFCRQHGVIRATDYGDWVEALEIVGTRSAPRGRRLVVITNSGGEAEHAADAAERAGIPLVDLPADLAAKLDADWPLHGAANPLDYYAFAPQEEILPAVMLDASRHPDVDGVLLNIDQSWRFLGNERETGRFAAAVAVATREATGAFVALLSTSTNDPPDDVLRSCAAAGVPVLMGHGPAFRALDAVLRAGRPTAPPPARSGGGAASRAAFASTAGALPEFDAKRWLGEYGIDAPLERRATTVDEAVAAAEAIGYPVVVKADGPAHKEREGGVHLGCATAEMVRTAAAACGGRALVAQELRGGVEVLCGLVRDPLFGPMVVCGVGGSWAEAMRESARTALAPLTEATAAALVRDVVPLARRLDGPAIAAVARALVALGDAAHDEPRITEIDVNPLRVGDGSAVALDALIVLGEPT